MLKRTFFLLLFLAAVVGQVEVVAESAELGPSFRPGRIFSDNMVLQRDSPLPVWGWSEVDQAITVQFGGQEVRTWARAGERWELRLPPMSALSEPSQMVFRGSESDVEVVVSNVLVGDVWLCMGQSNMEMSMGFESEDNYQGILNSDEELEDTDYPQLRLLHVPKSGANFPVPDIAVQWDVSGPKTAEFFSAVAYTFGRELHRQTDVPVGLIHVSMGGAGIKRFLPREVQVCLPEFYSASLAAFTKQWEGIEATAVESGTTARQVIRDWEKAVINFCADADAQPPSLEWILRNYAIPEASVPLGHGLGSMYYGMIAPLVPFSVKGFVWYQGESNLADGELYGVKLRAWVEFLRDTWRQDELPFLAVEIPPYNFHESDWPMENAPLDQRERLNRGIRAVLGLPYTATVNTEDLTDEPTQIHARNKAPIGKRLARLANGSLEEADTLKQQH